MPNAATEFQNLLKLPLSQHEEYAINKMWDITFADNQAQGITAHQVGAIGLAIASSSVSAAQHASRISSVAASAAPVLGPVGIALSAVTSGLSAKATYSTYQHRKDIGVAVEALGDLALPNTIRAAAFAHVKKCRKLRRKGAAIFPAIGVIPAVYGLYRSTKDNKGVARKRYAQALLANALKGDECAEAVIRALINTSFDKLIANRDWQSIADKMKST